MNVEMEWGRAVSYLGWEYCFEFLVKCIAATTDLFQSKKATPGFCQEEKTISDLCQRGNKRFLISVKEKTSGSWFLSKRKIYCWWKIVIPDFCLRRKSRFLISVIERGKRFHISVKDEKSDSWVLSKKKRTISVIEAETIAGLCQKRKKVFPISLKTAGKS